MPSNWSQVQWNTLRSHSSSQRWSLVEPWQQTLLAERLLPTFCQVDAWFGSCVKRRGVLNPLTKHWTIATFTPRITYLVVVLNGSFAWLHLTTTPLVTAPRDQWALTQELWPRTKPHHSSWTPATFQSVHTGMLMLTKETTNTFPFKSSWLNVFDDAWSWLCFMNQ